MMKIRLAALCSVATCALVVACSGADSDSAPTGDDVGADASTTPETTNPTTDSGKPTGEADAGVVTDGGGDPDEEPDAALVSDAGPDGGACGPAAGDGAPVASACSSGLTFSAGGALVPGSYDLKGFTVAGTVGYCATYSPKNYAGRLDVAADGQGGFIIGERVAKVGGGGIAIFPNKTFTATTAGSTIKVTQTCGVASKSTMWGYSVSQLADKATITYSRSSGTSTVRYYWVMR